MNETKKLLGYKKKYLVNMVIKLQKENNQMSKMIKQLRNNIDLKH